jgi:hypothetical protein
MSQFTTDSIADVVTSVATLDNPLLQEPLRISLNER